MAHNKRTIIFAALFILISAFPAFCDQVRWLESYDQALKLAEKEGKPVMAFFYTTWCTWCMKMTSETFTDTAVVSGSREYVCVKIDAEKERRVAYMYGISAFPATLFLDPEGRIIWHEFGFRDAGQLSSRLREVVSVYRQAIAIEPYLRNAFEMVRSGRPDKAIDIIDGALAKYPDEGRLYAARGAIFMNIGNSENALSDFDKSLAINPNAYNVYIMRSMLYYKMRLLDKALADSDKAISLNKWAYEAYNIRGVIFAEGGDLEDAIKNFNTCLVINPKHEGALRNREVVEEKLKERQGGAR